MQSPMPVDDRQLEMVRTRRRYQDIEDEIFAELRRVLSTIGASSPAQAGANAIGRSGRGRSSVVSGRS
jgi:hypothetical protein